MDTNDKMELVKRIRTVNKKVYKKIFLLILKNDIKYSQNQNGVFINIDKISDNLLNDINELIKEYEL